MMNKKKSLTRSEFRVMDHLWRMPGGGAFIGQILADYPEPKPAYTTLATFLKILSAKGFVKSHLTGKMLWYEPLMTREEYMEQYLTDIKNTFFSGSFSSLVSFFAQRENLGEEEINEILAIIDGNNKK